MQTDCIAGEGRIHGMTVCQAASTLSMVDSQMLEAGIGQLFFDNFSPNNTHFQGDIKSSQIILGEARMKWEGNGEMESIGKFPQIYIQRWRRREYRYMYSHK